MLHSSYIAYGTSAIFATTSTTFKYAPAPVFYCTTHLAVPTSSSHHDFRASSPPTFLPLLAALLSPLDAILHRPIFPSTALVESFDIPRVNIVGLGP